MEYLQTFFAQYGALLAQGTWDTIVMSLVSTALAYVIGIPLGVFLVLTDPKKGLLPHKAVNAVLGWIVNIGSVFRCFYLANRREGVPVGKLAISD